MMTARLSGNTPLSTAVMSFSSPFSRRVMIMPTHDGVTPIFSAIWGSE